MSLSATTASSQNDVPVDSAKTSPPRRVQTRGGNVRKNWALLIPRIDRERVYSNCKSTVSSVRGLYRGIFFNGKTRASFSDRRARFRKISATSVQRDSLAPQQS